MLRQVVREMWEVGHTKSGNVMIRSCQNHCSGRGTRRRCVEAGETDSIFCQLVDIRSANL